MSDERDAAGLRGRLTAQAEDALGKLAQDLLENPLVSGALRSAFDAREKAVAAQEVAMGALNLPSAADLERLTRRLRSVSQRLEGIEDAIERVDEGVARVGGTTALEVRVAGIEENLQTISRQISELSERLGDPAAAVSRAQERLPVEESPPPARASGARARSR